jgi:hypothetical protein
MKGLKILRSVEPFTNDPKDKKMKICVYCANIATQIACFDVGGATVIEKYCNTCIKTIGKPSDNDGLKEK